MACTREKNPGQEEVLATAIQLNINEITLEKGSSETLMVNYVPAAGGRANLCLYDAGFGGSYRSSSLDADMPDSAWYVYFESAIADLFFNGRCYGLSVRPVSE